MVVLLECPADLLLEDAVEDPRHQLNTGTLIHRMIEHVDHLEDIDTILPLKSRCWWQACTD